MYPARNNWLFVGVYHFLVRFDLSSVGRSFRFSFVDSDGKALSKKALESLARECGFSVVSSVTKSKCDCVVAVDPDSSSGKAKKARDYGKPVVGSARFLEIVKQHSQ